MTNKARIEANKKNAEAKNRTRLKALRHGLRAEQVVLPTEDAAAFNAHRDAWFDEWKPMTHTRAVLVERAAVASWRLRRSVRVEAARLEASISLAIQTYDNNANDHVLKNLSRLRKNPAAALTELDSTVEGVQAQVSLWNDLAEAVDDGDSWNDRQEHHERLLDLMGFDSNVAIRGADHAAQASLDLLTRNLLRATGEAEPETVAQNDQFEAVARDLRKFIKDVIVDFRLRLAKLPTIAEIHARIAERASLDVSNEGRVLMGYEAQHDRSLRLCVRQLNQLRKSGTDLAAEAEAPSEPIGQKSLREEDLESVPDRPAPASPQHAAKTERDRSGRLWDVEPA